MKKMIVILLILAIAAAGVFASADTSRLTMSAEVAGGLYLGAGVIPVEPFSSLPTGFGDVNGYDQNLEIAWVSMDSSPVVFYFAYVTNNYYAPNSVPTVRMIANPFRHATAPSSIIRYSVTVRDSASVLIDQDGIELDPGFTMLGGSGLRQEDVKLSVAILREDIDRAAAGSYVATITFDIEAM